MSGPVLVELPKADLSNIPEMLRLLAQDFEAGEYHGAQFCIAVIAKPKGKPVVLAWGRVTTLEAIGALTSGACLLHDGNEEIE